MNILIIYPYWGIPGLAQEFLTKLASRGHEITAVYASEDSRQVKVYELGERVTVYCPQHIDLSPNHSMIRKYPFFLNLGQALSHVKFDVIVTHHPVFLTALQALRTAKKTLKPTVLEVHGVYAYRNVFLNLAQKAYLRTIGRWEFREATLIRCLTKEDAAEVVCYAPIRHKIRIVPNPVDIDLFKPAAIKSEERSLAWTGRWVPEKGLSYLMEAIAILVHRYSYKDVRLFMAGDGPQKPVMTRLIAKYRIEPNVIFLGSLPRVKLAEFLSRASIFVFSSIKEGMPFSVIEALSAGLPVVGTSIPGVKNSIIDKHNGLLVPPRDPEALAEAISILMNNKILRLKMSENARKHVLNNSSYERILPLLEQTYEEAIEVATTS